MPLSRALPGGPQATGGDATASEAPLRSGARGNRFARGRPPSRDRDGHWLPSDKDLNTLALVLECKQHPEGERPELARFWVESHHDRFTPELTNEGQNTAVTVQTIPSGGSTYLRYKLRCPKCRNEPVFMSARVEEALALVYEQGARQKEHFVPV